jgi:hypothetical protein
MWEDPANAQGGKWVLTMKSNPPLLDQCWSWLAMALIGEEFDDYGEDVCGAVVSLRSKVDRIQLWIRGKDDVERVNGVGKKLVSLLDVSEADGIGLEFQVTSLSVSKGQSELTSILSVRSTTATTAHPPTSSFPSTHPSHNRPSEHLSTQIMQVAQRLILPSAAGQELGQWVVSGPAGHGDQDAVGRLPTKR